MSIRKNKCFMKPIILLFLLSIFSTVSAATYYVSTTGSNDNPGTLISPWLTFQYAFDKAIPGDTVYFRGGVYYITRTVEKSNLNGTAENPICFFAFPDDWEAGNYPIIDGKNKIYDEPGMYFFQSSYIYIQGITIRNILQLTSVNYSSGFYVNYCSNITFEKCVAHDIGVRCFYIRQSDRIYLHNCDAYNVVDSLSVTPGNAGDGYLATSATHTSADTATSVIFRGCRAWNTSDDGWDIHTEGYMEVDSCWAINCGGYGIGDYGNGFKLGLGNSISVPKFGLAIKVTNSIAVYSNGSGITTNDNDTPAVRKMNIFNNTSDYNTYGYIIYNTLQKPEEEAVRIFINNIAYANTSAPAYNFGSLGIGKTSEFNSWDTPTAVTLTNADFMSLDAAQLKFPRKKNGSLPDITFGRLVTTSDCIDSGKDVGLTYYGVAPDLGYSEYVSGSITPVNPIYLSSVIENSTPSILELTYNMTLANIIPAVSAFKVKVNSVLKNVNSVSISGARILLTLSSPVVYGDVLTVAYYKPAINPLQTVSGGQAASVSAQPVTNNCLIPANQLPVINISSPGKSSSFTSPATIVFDVYASDPDGTISKVEFFNGSFKLAEITVAPYSFTWKDVPTGTYVITAHATDDKNGKTISDEITITVNDITTSINQLPVVKITSPTNSSSFEAPTTIRLTVDATDPDGSVNKVEYFIGTIKIGESFSAPYAIPFEIKKAGSYEIIAVASDNLNAFATSSSVIFYGKLYNDPDIINLYPNPNDGKFTISLITSPLSEKNLVTIVDLTGRTVYEGTLRKEENISQFDLSDINSGIYILMISTNKIVFTKRFIKT